MLRCTHYKEVVLHLETDFHEWYKNLNIKTKMIEGLLIFIVAIILFLLLFNATPSSREIYDDDDFINKFYKKK